MLEKAILFAKEKHQGQFDKSGVPYIQHPLFVASLCNSEIEKVVAVLHDTIEDTDTTIEEIRENFGEVVAKNVQLLTHDKNIPYNEYIQSLQSSNIAKHVKMADLRHNMDLSRLHKISKKDFERFQKYQNAFVFLAVS